MWWVALQVGSQVWHKHKSPPARQPTRHRRVFHSTVVESSTTKSCPITYPSIFLSFFFSFLFVCGGGCCCCCCCYLESNYVSRVFLLLLLFRFGYDLLVGSLEYASLPRLPLPSAPPASPTPKSPEMTGHGDYGVPHFKWRGDHYTVMHTHADRAAATRLYYWFAPCFLLYFLLVVIGVGVGVVVVVYKLQLVLWGKKKEKRWPLLYRKWWVGRGEKKKRRAQLRMFLLASAM